MARRPSATDALLTVGAVGSKRVGVSSSRSKPGVQSGVGISPSAPALLPLLFRRKLAPDGYMLRMSAPLSCGVGAAGAGPCPAAQPARIKRTNAAVSQLERLIVSQPARSGSGHCY